MSLLPYPSAPARTSSRPIRDCWHTRARTEPAASTRERGICSAEGLFDGESNQSVRDSAQRCTPPPLRASIQCGFAGLSHRRLAVNWCSQRADRFHFSAIRPSHRPMLAWGPCGGLVAPRQNRTHSLSITKCQRVQFTTSLQRWRNPSLSRRSM